MGSVPIARVVRSGVVESVHLGDVAVCDATGRLLASVGDPTRVAFARSCMKPIQAAVSLGAIDVPVPVPEIAVMCSSHNGEPVHVGAVRRLLRRAGLDVSALRNPAGWPMDAESATHVRAAAPVFQDCSGNHAGMLAGSARAGWPLESYRSRTHPHHRRVLPLVRALADAEPIVGVDGCGIPVHGLPLSALATMYARLAAAENTDRGPEIARAIGAMRAEPYLVGGRARDDTAIMEATPDIVVKEGAEALTCAVSLSAGIGVAVKVADGGYRAAGPATIEVLGQLGLLTPGARRRLRSSHRPAVRGGGRPVGHLEPILSLSPERA